MPKRKLKQRSDGRFRKAVKQIGKKNPKLLYGKTPEEAENKALEFKYMQMRKDISSPETLTVSGYLEVWLSSHRKKIESSTYNGYNNYIKNHISKDPLGDILLKDVKPMHIEEFYGNEFDKGLKGKTILQEHRILHKAFKQAVRNELIAKNPCDYVDAPRVEEYQLNVYDEEQFNILLDAIAGTDDEIPILLAGMCGLRRSEVFGLRWSDIDFDKGLISIIQVASYSKDEKKWIIKTRPKNRSSRRTFAIPSEIIPVLKAKQGIGLVCCNPDGSIVNGGTFSHHFSDILKRHGLPHIRFHDLRHFNATMMLKYKISDKEAAKRLGHANPITLRKTYQHVLDEMDKQNADKLNSILRKKSIKGQAEGQA